MINHITRFLLSLALLTPALAEAQIIEDYADAELEVYYTKHLVLDTTRMDTRFRDTQMSLRIGDGHALFASTKQMWADSLGTFDFGSYMSILQSRYPVGGKEQIPPEWLGTLEHEYLFKNMPEGKNKIFRNFGFDNYVYEEEIEAQEWILGDSVRTILGYECHLAECDYRGRHWIA